MRDPLPEGDPAAGGSAGDADVATMTADGIAPSADPGPPDQGPGGVTCTATFDRGPAVPVGPLRVPFEEEPGGTFTGGLLSDEAPPPSVRGQDEVPPSLYKRFERFELLGRGGMGAVYRAEDMHLRRSVAVKLLFEGDSGSRSGFLQEARSQARILHPNVCEVFEAGLADHVPFIVMRLVHGAPLHKVGADLSLEEKIRILRQVSLAIHEAHRLGIIHRDVKPGNVLVERLDDGSYKPYIADFGIARDVSVEPLGPAVGLAGTPAFMAPEQASGKGHLDRRTDVYGLGATLYFILTRELPFRAPNVHKVLKMLQEEAPPAPRSIEPGIPLDLEAIVLKCLEKDPAARYESAKALAEDLQRFLDGDPVIARPRSLGVRLWKRARKHKLVVGLAASAAVAALVVAGLWLRSQQLAAQREELARALGGDVREMQLFMRSAHTLPLHDLEDERAYLRDRLAAIEARTKAAGEAGFGPGHDALGRGHLALQDAAGALDHLRRAEATGYHAPGFDYAMGLALVEVYRQEMEKASRIPNKSDREARIADVQRAYRDPAIVHLQAALGQGVESPEYARGLIAYHEGRHEDALRHAEAAFSAARWLYEAKKLEGDALYAIGSRTRHDRVVVDYVRTMEHFALAAEAYRTAAEIARSDPAVHEAECELWFQAMNTIADNRDPVRTAFERARGACDRAIVASPDSPSGYLRLAFVHQLFAFWVVSRAQWLPAGAQDEEPVERALDEATEKVEEAARRSPEDPFASYLAGATWRMRAQHLQGLHRRDDEALDSAVTAYEATIARDPAFLWAHTEECDLLRERGRKEAFRGKDPRPSFDRALERCRRAQEIDPDFGSPYMHVIQLHLARAEHLVGVGLSPRAAVEEGLRATEERQKRSPTEWNTAYRADLHRWEAEYALLTGEDPGPALARAEAEVARLGETVVPAGECDALVAAVTAEAHLARLLSRPGPHDPSPEIEAALARARAGLTAALAKWPRGLTYAVWLGRVEVANLRYRTALGKASPKDADAALAPVAGFLRESPDDPSLHEVAARAHEARAELLAHRKQDAAAEIAAGIAQAERAVAVAPGLGAGYAALGRLRLLAAQAAEDAGQRRELARAAAQAFSDAEKRNPLLGRRHAVFIEEARRESGAP